MQTVSQPIDAEPRRVIFTFAAFTHLARCGLGDAQSESTTAR